MTLLEIGEPLSMPLGEAPRTSPDWVRISYASALALRFKSGRSVREFDFGGINLLLNYSRGLPVGLRLLRPGAFAGRRLRGQVVHPGRVAAGRTDELVERMARYESAASPACASRWSPTATPIATPSTSPAGSVRRLATPLSILVAPPTLNRERLTRAPGSRRRHDRHRLDAVTEELFRSIRSDVPQGGLDWEATTGRSSTDARDIYGPWKVNCHTLVGLGETDHDLMGSVRPTCSTGQIFSYLFCFNPEPDSAMATMLPRAVSSAGAASNWPSSCSRRRGLAAGRLRLRRRAACWRRSRRRRIAGRSRRGRRQRLHDQRLPGRRRRARLYPANGQLATGRRSRGTTLGGPRASDLRRDSRSAAPGRAPAARSGRPRAPRRRARRRRLGE